MVVCLIVLSGFVCADSVLFRCLVRLVSYPPVTAVMTIFLCLRATGVRPPWRSLNFGVICDGVVTRTSVSAVVHVRKDGCYGFFNGVLGSDVCNSFLALSLVCSLFTCTSDKHVLFVRAAAFYSSWNAYICRSSSVRVCVSDVAWSALL